MNRICFSRDSISLVAVIVLLLILGVSISVATSLVGTGTIGSLHTAESAQALGIAHGGVEWLLEKLETETNWTQANLNTVYGGDHVFGAGKFNIAVGASAPSSNPTKVSFTSSGLVANPDGLNIQRQITITALKLPPAFLFALYHGSSTAPAFGIQSSSTINGDVWSTGSVTVTSSTVTNGLVYVPTGRTVTGASFKIMPAPSLAMPVINPASYTTLMTTQYDSVIDTAPTGGGGDINRSTNLILNGDTYLARDYTTSGSITISGNGRIVASRHINLHASGVGSLTVEPLGGDILFLAGGNVTVGNSATVTLKLEAGAAGVCRLYSRSNGSNNQLVRIRGANTLIRGGKIYARRQIIVESGADVIAGTGADINRGSLLFVDRPADNDNNNWIEITGSGTNVSNAVISTGRNQSNLRITSSASVTGLVYSYDTGGNGRLALNACSITGSVVADLYRAGVGGPANNRILAATVTYSSTSLPDPPPEGFEGYATKQPNSWDGV